MMESVYWAVAVGAIVAGFVQGFCRALPLAWWLCPAGPGFWSLNWRRCWRYAVPGQGR